MDRSIFISAQSIKGMSNSWRTMMVVALLVVVTLGSSLVINTAESFAQSDEMTSTNQSMGTNATGMNQTEAGNISAFNRT
jgi:hypothetical protein